METACEEEGEDEACWVGGQISVPCCLSLPNRRGKDKGKTLDMSEIQASDCEINVRPRIVMHSYRKSLEFNDITTRLGGFIWKHMGKYIRENEYHSTLTRYVIFHLQQKSIIYITNMYNTYLSNIHI